ncbi:MAG: gp53-like domain-containing protein [Cetobacterium sp.]
MPGYDKVQLARDTKENIELNKGKLAEFEPVIATDEGKLYMKIQGEIKSLAGIAEADINYDIKSDRGVASSQLTKELDIRVIANKEYIEAVEGEIGKDLNRKLDKGSYEGTASDLLEKGSFEGKADELLPKEDAWRIDAKEIGNTETSTTIRQLWDTGFYRSQSVNNKWNDLPSGCGNSFELTVTSTNNIGIARTLVIKSRVNNRIWICSQINTGEVADWTNWQEIFTTESCPISKAQSGYCKLANGMIIQWGRSGAKVGKFTITYPIAFSNENYCLTGSVFGAGTDDSLDYIFSLNTPAGSNKTAANWKNCSVGYRRTNNTFQPGGSSDHIGWMAIGY